LQESLAIADVVIAVLNGSRRTFEDGLQAFLSLEKGEPGHLLAIGKQEIKDEVHKVGRAPLVGCGLNLGKGSGSIGTNRTQLAVEIGRLNAKRRNRICGRRISIGPIEALRVSSFVSPRTSRA
jgi:hypothetical protein